MSHLVMSWLHAIDAERVALTLAHVRRHDYLVNLVQLLIEAALFFNPAVWWLSRQLRIEREACCDALAASVVGGEGDEPRYALAETLLRFATTRDHRPALAPVTPAFADGNRDSHPLVDRIRRLAQPHARPRVRLPWYTLLGLSALCLVILGGLHTATDLTVTAIAKAMTPHERMERLEEVRHTHGPGQEIDPRAEESRITVRGTVRTADGEPLPESVTLKFISEVRSHTTHTGQDVRDAGGRFERTIPAGRIHIEVSHAAGYAPLVVGPYHTEPGDTLDDIELVLDRGFTARLQLLDSEGEPIPHAALSYTYRLEGRRWAFGSGSIETDAAGIATVERAIDEPIELTAEIAGFQHDRETFTLEPDTVPTWQLRAARPTSGIVRDRDTGAPVPDAHVHLLRRSGFMATGTDPRSRGSRGRTPLATTDDQGRFTLDTLNDAATYALMVLSDTHGATIVEDITAGQSDIVVEAGPHLYVRGRIVGDLAPILERAGRRGPSLRFVNPITVDNSTWSHQRNVPLTLHDGEAHFEVRDLVPGRLELLLPGHRHEVGLDDGAVDDLVLDLDELLAPEVEGETNKRRVILRLEHPEGWPAPRGTIEVQARGPDPGSRRHHSVVELVDGRAEFDAPAPGHFHYQPKQLVGYWFSRAWIRDVVEGDEPQVFDVPTEPAGGIHGRVLDPDGRPAHRANLSLRTIERPPQFDGTTHHVDGQVEQSERRPGHFHVSSAVFGGVYRVIASSSEIDNEMVAVSEPLRVDADEPVHEVELRFVEGRELSVEVVGPDGEPMVRVPVQLLKRSEIGVSMTGAERYTDRDGRHTWRNVNTELPIEYYALVGPTDTLRGTRVELDPASDQPTRVELEPGATLEGVVIDDETGEPWPHATVQLQPVDLSAQYSRTTEVRADERGRFVARHLEPIRYRIRIDRGLVPGTEVRAHPDGTRSFRLPGSTNWPEAAPGTGEPVEVRAAPRDR